MRKAKHARDGRAQQVRCRFVVSLELSSCERFLQLLRGVRYTADYVEEVTLRDGLRLRVRLVRPSDKEILARGFDRLSPRSRYQRFFTKRDHLTPDELRYLTECDGIDHVAIGAVTLTDGGEDQGVGIARFVRNRERPDTAEAAVAVIDDYQKRGIGHLLLSRLIEAARERGINSFYCDVLSSNDAVQKLLGEAAPGLAVRSSEAGVTTVDVPFDALVVKPEEPRTPLARLLALVGEGLVLVRHVLGADKNPQTPASTA